MSEWAFFPGQRVVCVNDSQTCSLTPWPVRKGADLDGLTKGRIYTVKALLVEYGAPTLQVKEISRHRIGERVVHGFHPSRFRGLEASALTEFRKMAIGQHTKETADLDLSQAISVDMWRQVNQADG